jgi:hypothetical protein
VDLGFEACCELLELFGFGDFGRGRVIVNPGRWSGWTLAKKVLQIDTINERLVQLKGTSVSLLIEGGAWSTGLRHFVKGMYR